jgi:hypothetical protein
MNEFIKHNNGTHYCINCAFDFFTPCYASFINLFIISIDGTSFGNAFTVHAQQYFEIERKSAHAAKKSH